MIKFTVTNLFVVIRYVNTLCVQLDKRSTLCVLACDTKVNISLVTGCAESYRAVSTFIMQSLIKHTTNSNAIDHTNYCSNNANKCDQIIIFESKNIVTLLQQLCCHYYSSSSSSSSSSISSTEKLH